MPEGHTIHRAARDQHKAFANQTLEVTSPQGRFSSSASEINGQKCASVEAYGKHLIYRFDTPLALHIHLGLYGKFRLAKRPEPEPRGAVRVRLLGRTHVVDVNGPNTCELLDPQGLAALLARIGPDVLRKDADPDRAFARIAKSRTAIGQLLMDQSVIAGIGNIYRSEILWRQGVHPRRPGRDIDRGTFDVIWADAVKLLNIGVKANAIVTVDGVAKSRSRYGERVNIFAKAHCPSCHMPIEKFELANRRVFACQTCQPE
jgi:endonuclease VIII